MLMCGMPRWNLERMPHAVFSEIFLLSSWASELKIVNISSPDASIVFTFSFSKMMGMPRAFSFLLKFRLSAVLRAKRLIDFVITRSTRPSSQAAIMSMKPLRFLVPVPEIPSSAKMPASSQPGVFSISLV